MSGHKHKAGKGCCPAGCRGFSRRDFLASLGVAGGSALALQMGLFNSAVAQAIGAAAKPGAKTKPKVRVAFTRRQDEPYFMGWPGAAYDIPASQALYTDVLNAAAQKLGVEIDIVQDALLDEERADAFAQASNAAKPDGIVLVVMGLHPDGWGQVDRVLENRDDIPVVVFAPQGTQFTPTLHKYREIPRMFVGATQDVEWLETALRMIKAVWMMGVVRIATIHGDEEAEQRLEPLGTTLHHMPLERFALAYDATANSAEAREIAAAYKGKAKGIVEPSDKEILEAARTYVANRQIMAETNCQAVTMDCLGLVTTGRTPPPCMAYMQLMDEGTCGACERDVTATMSLLLSSYLLDRPAFLHNPSPNTVRNTYMGAHCTAPLKMDGFDGPDSEYILRSHHESDLGVAPQVMLREGQDVTLMKFLNPGEVMAATGTLLRNIETTPTDGVGGCRTAFEMSVDDTRDSRDIRGHHNVLIYEKHMPILKGFCQLAGLEISHITGGPA